MCGIAGFVGRGSRETLEKMGRALEHRGPDDYGDSWREGVGLAHTRLSILDVSPLGHQPMRASRRDIELVFNGEIYNFQELRDQLSGLGYSFRGGSDTEVILALYEEYGEECFAKMEGMFALALYDFDRGRCILARDRMGKKPLYWAEVSYGTIVFGSELKALMEHPHFKKSLDPLALSQYLFLDYVPTPRTIFEGVHKLDPGTYAVFENGLMRMGRFWGLSFVPSGISFRDALSGLDSHLSAAVQSRLVSDVPLGVFLSGGLDSSAVAYYAARASSSRIKTFSIGFDDPSFDESSHAEEVAHYLGTDHSREVVGTKELLDFVPDMAEVLDEPVADASIVPTYFLAKHTRRSVTVALGGDGGDELFAGYPTFQAESVARLYASLPEIVRSGIRGAVRRFVREGRGYMSRGFKVRKFVDGFDADGPRRHLRWLGTFDEDAQKRLLVRPLSAEALFLPIAHWDTEIQGGDANNRLLGIYMRTYLMDQVMVKVDRATMANALEARAPFLDARLVDFVNALPYTYKIYGVTGKYLLKRLMDGRDDTGRHRLPPHIVWRKKHGFGVPVAEWLRGELRDWSDAVLSRRFADSFGLRHEEIERLKHEHWAGSRDHRKPLWNLITLALWSERWM